MSRLFSGLLSRTGRELAPRNTALAPKGKGLTKEELLEGTVEGGDLGPASQARPNSNKYSGAVDAEFSDVVPPTATPPRSGNAINPALVGGAGALGLTAGVLGTGEGEADPNQSYGVMADDAARVEAGKQQQGIVASDARKTMEDIVRQDMLASIDEDITAPTFDMTQVDQEVEKELGFLDKVSSEFDMLTFGMMLLASNDGSKSVGQNIGQALIGARKAKQMQGKRTKEEDLAERRVAATEMSAQASLASAIRKNLSDVQKNFKATATEVKQGLAFADSVFGTNMAKKPKGVEQELGRYAAIKSKEIYDQDGLSAAAEKRGMSVVELHDALLAQDLRKNYGGKDSFFGFFPHGEEGAVLDKDKLTR